MKASALVPRVAALLGFSGDLDGSTVPTLAQATAWCADGQSDLIGRLVPDAVPQLLVTKDITATDTVALVPGSRVVRVYTNDGYVARHVPPNEFVADLAQEGAGVAKDGLFSPSQEDPVWTILPKEDATKGEVHVRVATGKVLGTTSAVVTYTEPVQVLTDDGDADPLILLQDHFHPLIIRYALYQAKVADEDDVGAQIVYQDYVRAIEEINVLNGGRQFGFGKPDGVA